VPGGSHEHRHQARLDHMASEPVPDHISRGAEIKAPLHDVVWLALSLDQDDGSGRVAAGPELAQHRQAVHVRKLEVDDYEVVQTRGGRQHITPRVDGIDPATLELELPL